MTVKLNSTKKSFLNQLLRVISEIDIRKGELVNVDCKKCVIEYTLPENYCVGSKDWGGYEKTREEKTRWKV